MNSAFWIVRLDHKDPRSPQLMDELLRHATGGVSGYVAQLTQREAEQIGRVMGPNLDQLMPQRLPEPPKAEVKL